MIKHTTSCAVRKAMFEIETECRQKANATDDPHKQTMYGMVAIACQKQRFSHENRCTCCAMAVAA